MKGDRVEGPRNGLGKFEKEREKEGRRSRERPKQGLGDRERRGFPKCGID